MKRLLVVLLLMGFALNAPTALAASNIPLWRKMWAVFTGENLTPPPPRKIGLPDDWATPPDEKKAAKEEQKEKPLTSIERLMRLQDSNAEITNDGAALDFSKKLELYNALKSLDIEGVWLSNGVGNEPWQAIAVRFIRSDAEIYVVVDYWKDGQVFRLMSDALEDLIEQTSSYRVDLSEKGVLSTRYGNRAAPLALSFLKLNDDIRSFFLYAGGAEVMHVTVLRKWHSLKEEERDDIATMNVGGITMSQFRMGNYPFPEKLDVCRRYLGE